MLGRLYRRYLHVLTSGGQLLLLAVAVRLNTPTVWRATLALVAILSIFAWLIMLRRMRIVGDMPTSRVASAAQGYVELQGIGKPLDGLPLLTPLTQLPCLWYRFKVEKRSDDNWVEDSAGESDASFLLQDTTGVCVVDPDGAEVLPARCDKWQKGDYRYTQWLILEHEAIYVVGSFRTIAAGSAERTVAEEVKEVLVEWKEEENKAGLLRRFDLDGDGAIDIREWELARAQARREVEQRCSEERTNNSELFTMGKPADGRLYLISALSGEKLARHYRLWAYVHVGIFFAALVAYAKIAAVNF